MELLKVTGRRAFELLAILPDRSGIHQIAGGILKGLEARVSAENIHPNLQHLWRLSVSIPEAGEDRWLAGNGLVVAELDNNGVGWDLGPDRNIRVSLRRHIIGEAVKLEPRHGAGPKQIIIGGHAEYYPDYGKLNVGLTRRNYLFQGV